jgi:hypothetical protein
MPPTPATPLQSDWFAATIRQRKKLQQNANYLSRRLERRRESKVL